VVGVGSDFWGADACSALIGGPTVSPPVVVTTTVRCSDVGCGAGSGSGLAGTKSAGGRVSLSIEDVSTGGVLVTTGVGVGAGSATCVPLTMVVLSPLGCCCSLEEGCSFAQASLAAKTKAKRHKTSATSRARGCRLFRWAWRAVFLGGCPRVKSLSSLPIVSRCRRHPFGGAANLHARRAHAVRTPCARRNGRRISTLCRMIQGVVGIYSVPGY